MFVKNCCNNTVRAAASNAIARPLKTILSNRYITDDQSNLLQNNTSRPTPRFTDNKNGTVTDNLTGLVWLKDANSFGSKTWNDAVCCAGMLAAGMCGLLDGSAVGDWRLPNCKELQSLVDRSQYHPALPAGHPFYNVQADYYWSCSSDAHRSCHAWGINMYYGLVYDTDKSNSHYLWPVRGRL